MVTQLSAKINEPPLKLFHLNEYGVIKVSGKNADKLLQGQLTCNIQHLNLHHALFSAQCNPQGRIISLFYIAGLNDSFYLFMRRTMIPKEIEALKKYALFYPVEILDISQDIMLFGLSGLHPTGINDALTWFNLDKTSRYVYLGFKTHIEALWESLVAQKNSLVCKEIAWREENILTSHPEIYPETSEKFLPHELNLQARIIDFHKGCYTGQEIIARMQYRGKLKSQLVLASIHHPSFLKPGSDIYAYVGTEIKASGLIVDSFLNENNRHYALIITDKVNVKDNHLFLDQDQDYFKIEATP